MEKQRIRHLFPGSNTAAGFVGFYEDLRSLARRTVILKGGPGVGKSTLMREVGKHYEQQGLDIDYYSCSGDPASLDAVRIPSKGFLILDGTAPHIVDPKLPGAGDGILNLGACLHEQQLEAQRAEIESLTREISGCFARAYRCLRAALALRQDAGAVYDAAFSEKSRLHMERELLSLLGGGPDGGETHVFAQAITCQGVLQEIDSIVTEKTYCIDAPWGFPSDALLQPVLAAARQNRLKRAVYHDPLDAGCLAHLNAGGTVFTTAVMMDASSFVPDLDREILRRESQRLAFDKAVYDLTVNQAMEALSDAKQRHDALERYYIDAMDYARLDDIKAEFLEKLP